MQEVKRVLAELDAHLVDVRRILARPATRYVTVTGTEFLVEVPVARAKDVPRNWVRASAYVLSVL